MLSRQALSHVLRAGHGEGVFPRHEIVRGRQERRAAVKLRKEATLVTGANACLAC